MKLKKQFGCWSEIWIGFICFTDKDLYFIFYGEGPVTWHLNDANGVFNHNTNYYEDYSYYFITTVDYQAKRIENIVPVTGSPDIEVSDFTDYAVHEVDERNIAGIGRTWYGEIYDYVTQYDFVFEFPNIKTNVKDISPI